MSNRVSDKCDSSSDYGSESESYSGIDENCDHKFRNNCKCFEYLEDARERFLAIDCDASKS